MFNRLKQAWSVLTGKIYLPHLPKTVYVKSDKPPTTFVQLLAWRDSIIALDESGGIWLLKADYLDSGFVYQFLQESPRRY